MARRTRAVNDSTGAPALIDNSPNNPYNPPAPKLPDIRGRFPVEAKWPAGGYMVTKPLDTRNYDVNLFTGASYSAVRGGTWARGQIVRMYQPVIHPPMLGYWAYDP